MVFQTLGFPACCQAEGLIASVVPILVVEPEIRERVRQGPDLFFSLRDMGMLAAPYYHCTLDMGPRKVRSGNQSYMNTSRRERPC